jgi:hypothetical protein
MIITAGALVQLGDLLTIFERDVHRAGRGWDGPPAHLAAVLSVAGGYGYELAPVALPEGVAGHPVLALDLLGTLRPAALRRVMLPGNEDATVRGLMITLEVLKPAGPHDWHLRLAAQVEHGVITEQEAARRLPAHAQAPNRPGMSAGRDRIEARLAHLINADGHMVSIARLRPTDEVIPVGPDTPGHEEWLSPDGIQEARMRAIAMTLCLPPAGAGR